MKMTFIYKTGIYCCFYLLFFLPTMVFSQSTLCHHDDALHALMVNDPEMEDEVYTMEEILGTEMENNPQAIMNGQTYTVPVVFHVLNLGESIGSGSNIPNSQILQALDDLNNDFSNASGSGYDVQIQFCLAQQDPDGNSTFDSSGNNITGIQRADASSVPSFSTFGIWPGVNEIQAKSLSNWPENDYVNIWIAHRLYVGGATGDAAGFAYFPIAGDDIDGIALRSDVTGVAGSDKVITHEAGHFFALHHTFRGGDAVCPINNTYDCEVSGDGICQTRTHGTFSFPFPCDESLYVSCDPSFSEPYLVTENHMNYTDNSCRDEFVPDQAMRMRCALMMERSGLMNSIGCEPGCTSTIAGFTVPNSQVAVGTSLTFTNTSVGATSYSWTVNDQVVSTGTNLTYLFDMGGIFEVCVDAFGPDCVSRFCSNIGVFPFCLPPPDTCELVTNGNFEQLTGNAQSGSGDAGFANVCAWNNGRSTSFYCNLQSTNSVAVRVERNRTGPTETIVSEDELALVVNKYYEVRFNYLVANDAMDDIYVVLTDDPDGNYTINNTTVIGHLEDIAPTVTDQTNHECYPEGSLFSSYTGGFTYNGDGRRYVSLTAVSPSVSGRSFTYFDNVSINCCPGGGSCNPIPDFEYDTDCPSTFVGTNQGDGDSYTWNFLCDGYTSVGPTVTRDFPAGTECVVCLTISCDFETGATICKTVTIPELSDDCTNDCLDLAIEANICENEDGEENTFITNFTVDVPTGTGPCGDLPLQSNSSSVDIDLVSYTTEAISNSEDRITIGMSITTPAGLDMTTDAVSAGLTLCDPDGNIICYNIKIIGSECGACLPTEFEGDAECTDDNLGDDTFVYSGSIPLSNLPGNTASDYSICPSVSSGVGLSTQLSGSGNNISLDYELAINGSPSSVQLLLCLFDANTGERFCVTVTINIPEPCPEPPTDCVQDWGNKVAEAKNCHVVDGQVQYTVSMSNVWLNNAANELVPCDGNIYGSIEGGIVQVTGTVSGPPSNVISYEAVITMPCGFNTSEIYELRIILCDREGNLQCIVFNVKFPDCDAECEDREDGDEHSGKGRNNNNANFDDFKIYPNPASNLLTISSNIDLNEQHTVSIYNPIGKVLVTDLKLNATEMSIDVSNLNSGVHFVKIVDSKNEVVKIEKIIILK